MAEARVLLDPFSRGFWARLDQASQVNPLVRGESEWLADEFPGTVARHSNLLKCFKNIGRTARQEGIDAYIIHLMHRKRGLAYGIGTIIFDQTVVHPELGEVRADDIDYWLGLDARDDLGAHRQVVRSLVKKVLGSESEAPAIMATDVLPGSDPRGVALSGHLRAVGKSAVLQARPSDDPLGLTKGGRKLQLYVNSKTDLRDYYGRRRIES